MENMSYKHYRTNVDFKPQSVDKEKRTVEVIWSTSAGVPVYPKRGRPFIEQLSMDNGSVLLERLLNGAAVLNNHKFEDINDQIGVVENAWIENNVGVAKLRFSKRESVKDVFDDVVDGIIRGISCCYIVSKRQKVERKKDDMYDRYLAVLWEPVEISLVPVRADVGAQVRKLEFMTVENEEQKDHYSEKKEETELPKTEEIDLDLVKNDERQRISGITTLCRKFQMPDEFTQNLINDGSDINKVRSLVLDNMSERTATRGIKIEVGRDERDTKKEGMIDALMHRSQGGELSENGRNYRSHSLIDLARQYAGNSPMGRQDIVKRAFHSSSDFPEILGETAKKTLVSSYENLIKRQSFWPLAKVKSAPDFRPVSRVRMGEMPDLEAMEEGSEYSYGTLGEGRETYSIGTFGKAIGITRNAIINDDLGALDKISNWGHAIARLESKLFWKCLTDDNIKLGDNKSLFHVDHNNTPKTDAGLSIDSLSDARLAMSRHQGIDKRDKDYLDIQAEYLIIAPEQQTAAQQLFSNSVVPGSAGEVNPFLGAYKTIVSNYFPNNRWVLAAGTGQGIDMIEMCYLDGIRTPFIDWKTDWNTDSIAVKCRMDVAAKAIDYRGFYRGNKGK